MKNVLIIGATSKIASETAKIYAERGYNLILSGRDFAKLESVKNNLIAYYPNSNIKICALDILDYSSHKKFTDDIVSEYKKIDICLIAYGSLPNQEEIERNFEEIHREIEVNMISVISLITQLAIYFENERSGTIAVISSAAGDRGRKSNYVYGAAKGAISMYLQGLRNRLDSKGVNVLTIKPGFVNTPMTENIPKNFLFVEADRIAKGIVKAIDRKKDVVYLPSFWRLIMFIIKAIPERFFKKLSL